MNRRDRRARKLRPAERARQDQHAAAARQLGATNTRTAVCTMVFAEPGDECCWCDCPLTPDSPHYQPGYVCAGCWKPANYVLHVLHGHPMQSSYPVCDRHRSDLVSTISGWFGDLPTEFRVMSVLDDEGDEITPGGER